MEFIIAIGLFIGLVLLMRLLGAWMLRIDEIIQLLKEIREELRVNRMLKD
jgi:hypothetical protein